MNYQPEHKEEAALRVVVDVSQEVLPVVTLTLVAPVPCGAWVRLRALTLSQLMGVRGVRLCDGHGVAWEEVQRYSKEAMALDWGWWGGCRPMVTFRVPRDYAQGEVLAVEMAWVWSPDSGCGAEIFESRFSDVVFGLDLVQVENLAAVEGRVVSSTVFLDLVAGDCARLEAYRRLDGGVRVVGFDRTGNPTTLGLPAYTLVERGERVAVDVLGESGVPGCVSGAQPVGQDGTPVWFGDFHWHCQMSCDGERSLHNALRSARDELCLDFAGPSDHIWGSGRYTDEYGPSEQAAVCRGFDEPGRFVTLPGAEISGRMGHANVYARDWEAFLRLTARIPEWLGDRQGHPDLFPQQEVVRWCATEGAILIPHHTNMDSTSDGGVVRADGRVYWGAWHWPMPAECEVVRAVEMNQARGAFESEAVDPRWRVFFGGLGGSVQMALARGYKLGFTGGTDNHRGWPTRCGAGFVGLTGVLAPELTTAALFDALRARRTYATTGARIVADATLNGHPIGSVIRLHPLEKRVMEIAIAGTAPLAGVQIISMGHVLAELPVEVGSLECRVRWEEPRRGFPLHHMHYYVRARQVDGHVVWLSPFYLELADA